MIVEFLCLERIYFSLILKVKIYFKILGFQNDSRFLF